MLNPVWKLCDATLEGRAEPRLSSVSLEIPAGVTAIMGASGAGKSSLLGLLTGFEKPDAGAVEFACPDSAALPLFWSPQDDGLWPHLTVEQHLEYVLPTQSKLNRSAVEWLEVFGLGELKSVLPDSLSQGERSRLALARALASEAAVLVLDEPLVHVAPRQAHRYWQIIAEHVPAVCSAVVFSTHDPDAVRKYAERVVCLNGGRLAFSGTVDSLWEEPPSEELAWLLGPCNWMSEGDLNGEAKPVAAKPAQLCVRPSRLGLTHDGEGPFAVESLLKTAGGAEVRLREQGAERRLEVFTTQNCEGFAIGDAVRISVSLPKSDRPK